MSVKPRLSVIVCLFDMAREAPRTILSTATPYQKDIAETDFEVIAVDNGSPAAMPDEWQALLPANVRYVRMPNPHPSPVFAMNWAAREVAAGKLLLFSIDGARIFSNRLLAETVRAHEIVEDAFVYTLSWHLGPKLQTQSILEGYDRAVEDALLDNAGWPANPDSLFDISVLAASSRDGFFRSTVESSAFSVSRKLFNAVGGFDERFVSPGAGIANLEIFSRYVTRPEARNVCLLGEGTFHQVHGGIATSGKVRWPTFVAEYRDIFGLDYQRPSYDALYFGRHPRKAAKFIGTSLDQAL